MVPLRLVVGDKQKNAVQILDLDEVRVPKLHSVNVGLPRDVTWNGKTVRTSVWKSPVDGRRMVRKLDIDGDAQADLAGHGGEHRAVRECARLLFPAKCGRHSGPLREDH